MCNHLITFSTDAGINDVLKIEFLKVSPNTIVNFAVGETFESSKGSTMVSAEGQTLQLGFPQSIYLSIEHEIGDEDT